MLVKLKHPKRIFRLFFSYTRQERNGILVLVVILFVLLTVNFIIGKMPAHPNADDPMIRELIVQWEAELDWHPKLALFQFDPNGINKEALDSLALPDRVKNTLLKYRESGGVFYQASDLKKIYGMTDSLYAQIEGFISIKTTNKQDKQPFLQKSPPATKQPFYFDPNTASGDELSQLGFSEFQIKNLQSYKSHGGTFKNVEGLRKIYGVDSVFYSRLAPWVKIEPEETQVPIEVVKGPPVSIELNTADSVVLVSLKGIGPVFAKRIMSYRKLLGGFCNKKQLLEVYNLPEETYLEIEPCLMVDTMLVRKISLNFSDTYTLAKHPYISKETAKKISSQRNKNGPFKNCLELLEYHILDKDTYHKLRPYLKIN